MMVHVTDAEGSPESLVWYWCFLSVSITLKNMGILFRTEYDYVSHATIDISGKQIKKKKRLMGVILSFVKAMLFLPKLRNI